MLQMVGIRPASPIDGPDQVITEVTVSCEDVRFVSASSFAPLNKLSHFVVTPHVHVLFSDHLKN